MLGVRVAVRVGVLVMVAVGKTNEVKVGNGVEDGLNVTCWVRVGAIFVGSGSRVGNCLKVAVAVGKTNNSGSSSGGNGLMAD